MADYNTFLVVDCKKRKELLTTSSARKAAGMLAIGVRIDIWNNNTKIETIYIKNKERITPYIAAEKQYIRNKQEAARVRNQRRKQRLAARLCCV